MTDKISERACCTVALSSEGHFPRGITWYVEWLPKGYGPTAEDRLVCAFPDQEGWAEKYGLGSKRPRPPLIEAVCRAIEDYYKSARIT